MPLKMADASGQPSDEVLSTAPQPPRSVQAMAWHRSGSHHRLLNGQRRAHGTPALLSRRKARNGLFAKGQRGFLLIKESSKRTKGLLLKGLINDLIQLLAGVQKGVVSLGVVAPGAVKVPASLVECGQANKAGHHPMMVLPLSRMALG